MAFGVSRESNERRAVGQACRELSKEYHDLLAPLCEQLELLKLEKLFSPGLKKWWDEYKENKKTKEKAEADDAKAKLVAEQKAAEIKRKKKEILQKLGLTEEEFKTLFGIKE
ncbi:MAG: hypothetical protein G01um10143_462 [Parcubacteria group bacterium Gr01-1014_3]|nr:MAG: hypothetical protein G01um10143_462 [Parcubacteria group bacterium Gr01-1014_3]